MSNFTEYQMPEFAVVGNTAFIKNNMSQYTGLVKVTITKVLKRQVVVQWSGTDWLGGVRREKTNEARFSVEKYGKRLKEVAAGVDFYRKDELISEEAGIALNNRREVSARLDKARGAVANCAEAISGRGGRDLSVGILDERMNVLKTAAEEFTAAQMAYDELGN